MEKSPEWTLVIKPKSSLFDFQLKQLWEYRDLLLLLVIKQGLDNGYYTET